MCEALKWLRRRAVTSGYRSPCIRLYSYGLKNANVGEERGVAVRGRPVQGASYSMLRRVTR